MASVPKRSCGTRSTPLFISKTELGRRATAHRWQGQLSGQVQHCPPLGLELEAGAGGRGSAVLQILCHHRGLQTQLVASVSHPGPRQVPWVPEAA